MNGKKAKRMRRWAASIVTNVMKESLGSGYNEYNQAMNCVGYDHAKNPETGEPMFDTDGTPLITVVNNLPGTVTCAWKFRTAYKELKKRGKHALRPKSFQPTRATRRERRVLNGAHRLRELKARANAVEAGSTGPVLPVREGAAAG